MAISTIDGASRTRTIFYLGKTRSRYSKRYTLPEYAELYQSLTGSDRPFESVEDIVQLTLEEWQQSFSR